jgi:hypothetical protein
MRNYYDWTKDEAPALPRPVQASVHYGCARRKCLAYASRRAKVNARRFYKPRVNRLQRRAVRELLATGVEPRSVTVTFTCWDIV